MPYLFLPMFIDPKDLAKYLTDIFVGMKDSAKCCEAQKSNQT